MAAAKARRMKLKKRILTSLRNLLLPSVRASSSASTSSTSLYRALARERLAAAPGAALEPRKPIGRWSPKDFFF